MAREGRKRKKNAVCKRVVLAVRLCPVGRGMHEWLSEENPASEWGWAWRYRLRVRRAQYPSLFSGRSDEEASWGRRGRRPAARRSLRLRFVRTVFSGARHLTGEWRLVKG